MKMKIMVAAILAATSTSSMAQFVGTAPSFVEGRLSYTLDSDKFESRSMSIGAAVSTNDTDGVGLRVTTSSYDAPAKSTDGSVGKMTGSSQSVQLVGIRLEEDYTFHGAFGVKQSSAHANAGSVSQEGSDTTIVFDGELRLIMTDSLTIGLTVSRDNIESLGGLLNGTTATTVGGDIDLQLTDNLNLGVAAGNTHFSDSNDRQYFRTKLTYTFWPEHGVSAYVRTRNQWDSNPHNIQQYVCGGSGCDNPTSYFSPASRYDQSIGLQLRKAYRGLVYTAAAEVGDQHTTDVEGTKSADTIYMWQLGVQTQPGKRTGTTYGVNAVGTNTSMRTYSDHYRWFGIYSWMKVPF